MSRRLRVQAARLSPLEIVENDAPRMDSFAFGVLPLLLILFAGSGCSALIYEIVWYQSLQFVIGSTAVSLAVLLGTFMGGLCLGSIALPRVAAVRRCHPLRVYGAIELGIGICGVLALLGMPLISRIYITAVGHGFPAILLRAAICSVCLLPPTILMGASLPAIARWIKTTPQGISRVGLLYSANTVGAVFGCLLAGFYLLRNFDLATATYVAAAVNVVVALISFGLAKWKPWTSTDAPVQEPLVAALHFWPVYATIALSGACALGAEVVWTRILGLILGATVYTFSIILAVFLMGLGIGSCAGALLSRVVRPQVAIGYCQLLLTAAIAWTAFVVAKSLPYWPVNPKLSIDPLFTFQIDLVRAILAIFPATVLWGATFPLALAAVASGGDDPARPVAGIYAANTAGAIVGAVVFSMILVPHLGTQNSERLLIVLSGIAALCMLASAVSSWREKSGASWLAVSMIAVAILAATVPQIPPGLVAYGRLFSTVNAGLAAYGRLLNTGNTWRVLYVGEGLNSSLAISQFGNSRQFSVSGRPEASTEPHDMRLQRMLGHMPALLHPKPRSVLVVGFGAGVTAGSFLLHPGVQRIVICEIEPLIPPVTSQYFNNENYNVLHDPRTEVIYEDARNYILTTPEKFDIITSDPIHPWVKGSATLYTKEYFELVKEHLNTGGIVTQWVPLYETDLATVKTEIATFFDVFPGGTIWSNDSNGGGYDIVLLGQIGPARIQVDEVQARLDSSEYSGVAKSLRDVGFRSGIGLLATYAAQEPDLKPWLKGAEINRDGNLRLQYLGGLAVNANLQELIYDEILHYRRFPVNLFAGSDQAVQAIYSLHAWQ
jgi:spermidine synthase